MRLAPAVAAGPAEEELREVSKYENAKQRAKNARSLAAMMPCEGQKNEGGWTQVEGFRGRDEINEEACYAPCFPFSAPCTWLGEYGRLAYLKVGD